MTPLQPFLDPFAVGPLPPRPLSNGATACLLSSGTPYQNFVYVRKTHIAHHFDRADVCEFDYRAILERNSVLRWAVLACEWLCLPAVETIMHFNAALGWARSSLSNKRRFDAARGCFVAALFFAWMWCNGGAAAIGLYAASSAIMLQVLAAHDAFQHTYTVREHTDKSYKPGPEDRSAQYEEDNTYSDLISTSFPVLNALVSLNFGYHNAHHHQQMAPWWTLPATHKAIYGAELVSCPRILRFRHLIVSWLGNRVSRVLDSKTAFDQILKLHGEARSKAFIGDLGVSFLTM